MDKLIRWRDITLQEPLDDKLPENEDDNSFDDKDENPLSGMFGEVQKLLITPFGTYSPKNMINPTDERAMFMGDTNFSITEKITANLCLIDGVEALRVYSKYCFVVLIGIMFDPEEILGEIERKLDAVDMEFLHAKNDEIQRIDNNIELNTIVDGYIQDLNKASDFWILYVFPNGESWSEIYESEEHFDKEYDKFSKNENLTGYSEGILFTWKDKI